MSYLYYLCLLTHSGVQHILCCVLVLVFFVYDASCSGLSFLISPSIFSNVYSLEIIISKKNIGYDSAILIVSVPSGVLSSFKKCKKAAICLEYPQHFI